MEKKTEQKRTSCPSSQNNRRNDAEDKFKVIRKLRWFAKTTMYRGSENLCMETLNDLYDDKIIRDCPPCSDFDIVETPTLKPSRFLINVCLNLKDISNEGTTTEKSTKAKSAKGRSTPQRRNYYKTKSKKVTEMYSPFCSIELSPIFTSPSVEGSGLIRTGDSGLITMSSASNKTSFNSIHHKLKCNYPVLQEGDNSLTYSLESINGFSAEMSRLLQTSIGDVKSPDTINQNSKSLSLRCTTPVKDYSNAINIPVGILSTEDSSNNRKERLSVEEGPNVTVAYVIQNTMKSGETIKKEEALVIPLSKLKLEKSQIGTKTEHIKGNKTN